MLKGYVKGILKQNQFLITDIIHKVDFNTIY